MQDFHFERRKTSPTRAHDWVVLGHDLRQIGTVHLSAREDEILGRGDHLQLYSQPDPALVHADDLRSDQATMEMIVLRPVRGERIMQKICQHVSGPLSYLAGFWCVVGHDAQPVK